MKLKTLRNDENRLLIRNTVGLCFALSLMLCVIGGAMAAGEPDPTPTTSPDNGGELGVWDIFDKKEIVQAAKNAWTNGFADAGGNLLIGVAVVGAFLSILLALLIGAGVMNFGKLGSNNDTHSTGKSMMGTAVGSAIMLVLGLCFVVMILSGWLQ